MANKTRSDIYRISYLAVLFFLAILSSLLLWFINVTFNVIKDYSGEPVSPSRWLVSVFLPLIIVVAGLRKGSLSKSGALLGYVVGFSLTISSYIFMVTLLTFFISSSKATKFRSKEKKKLEHDFKEGGQRNWVQVLCNGGMATFCAVFYIMESGCGELAVDFNRSFRASWLSMGILGALSAANGDTWASELGSVLSKSKPRLITTFKQVPKGANGGVSFWGLVVSWLGGVVVGVMYYSGVVLLSDTSLSPPQWPLVLVGGAAGFIGSIVDSLLGATLQYSGLNKNGVVVERPGKDVNHISGVGLLDNHSVNLVCTVIMGNLTPRLANLLWP